MLCTLVLSSISSGLVGTLLAGLALALLFLAVGVWLLRGGIGLLREGHKASGIIALTMGVAFLLFLFFFLSLLLVL